jgi:hypothetical protein
VFDRATGAFVTRFGGKRDEDHHRVTPEGITVTSRRGLIYVAGTADNPGTVCRIGFLGSAI